MDRSSLPVWLYPANLLTWLRFLAIPAVVWLLQGRHPGAALAIFVVAGLSDGLDGWVARRFGQQSALGAYLDPLADKLLLSTLFVVLALQGAMPWLLTILVLLRDLSILTSAGVIFFATGFRDFRPTWWGKINTAFELATIGTTLLVLVAPAGWIFSVLHAGWIAVFVLSFVSGIDYALTAAKRYHASREGAE